MLLLDTKFEKGEKVRQYYYRLFNISLIIIFALLATIVSPFTNRTFATDANIVRVNGSIIYEDGTYNSSHGILGVSFDTVEMSLNLTSASIESIYANGDLTIKVSNNNAVDATTSDIAVEARGNLSIFAASSDATLNIMAKAADARAIEISAGSTLTIGEPLSSNFVTVSIQRGRNVNTTGNTVVTPNNTYNYTESGPGGPGVPGEPIAGDPLTISIDGTVVIDETADPQITSAEGDGWNIERFESGPGYVYGLNIDQGATVGYLTGTGDGDLTITGDGNIAESEDGFSINMDGRINIFGGMSDVAGDLNLAGGIFTQGFINTYDRAFTIGSVGLPSTKGVLASEVMVSMGDLTINTTGNALEYYNPTPAEGDGLVVESSAGKSLTVESSNIATVNVTTMTVSGGGKIDLNYTSSLGIFSPQASHWPWVDMTGTEEENPLPITVTCEEGTSLANKYKMTTSEGNFLLESTAGTLFQLGWNIPGADDSIVTNGTVRVIAANGYRFTSGGYTDYSIEAGSPVTIELLPDYGYQYVSGGLNGNQTQPEVDKASYSFIMPSNHLHLSAIFEPTSDIINVNDDKINGASIEMPVGAINGNAKFTVSEAQKTDENSFSEKIGSRQIAGYIDLSLDEIIFKGVENDTWETSITELEKPMTVHLDLSEKLQGYDDYSVLRDHDGVITELPAEYNEKTGELSFLTDAFSDYAIIHGEKASNPYTYDNITNYFILSVISIAGLGICIYILIYKSKKTITTSL